jgi:hypothetical protein
MGASAYSSHCRLWLHGPRVRKAHSRTGNLLRGAPYAWCSYAVTRSMGDNPCRNCRRCSRLCGIIDPDSQCADGCRAADRAFTVHLPYGFFSVKLAEVTESGTKFGPVGYEILLLYLGGLFTLSLSGAGRLSLERWLETLRSRNVHPSMPPSGLHLPVRNKEHRRNEEPRRGHFGWSGAK